jgi:hypothetical protein
MQVIRILFATLATVLAASSAAPAVAANESFTTKLFSVQLPENWQKVQGAGARTGLWIFRSPNGNYKLRIRAEKDQGESIAVLGEQALERFVKRGTNVEVVKKVAMKAGGGDVHWAVVKSKRKTHQGDPKDFVTFRMMASTPKHGLHVVISLSGTQQKIDELMSVVDLVMSTFKIATAGAGHAQKQ